MAIEIRNLCKSYGKLALYEQFSLRVETEQVTAITGPSGGGKTTFLRMMAGLEPFSGEIAGLPSSPEGMTGGSGGTVAYLFQENRLLPWLTLEENVDLVMRSFLDLPHRRERLGEVLELLELEEFRHAYPAQLSGGMCRRVAIGRMMVYDSNILLLDEPFQGLDEALRFSLRDQLKKRWKAEKKTVIMVTHDLEEARYLADQVYAFRGRPIRATAET